MWLLSHFQRAELLLRGSHPHKWNMIGKGKMSSEQVSVLLVSRLLKCINGCQECGGCKKVKWHKLSANGQKFFLFLLLFLNRDWQERENKTISNKVSRDNVITWYTGLGPPGHQASYSSWSSCFNLTLCCGRYLTFCIHVRGMLLSASALHNIIVLLNATLNSWICLF